MEKEGCTIQLLLHPSAYVSAHGRHVEHIFTTTDLWFGVLSLLSKFLHLWFLLFDCLVSRQNVTLSETFYCVWALHR